MWISIHGGDACKWVWGMRRVWTGQPEYIYIIHGANIKTLIVSPSIALPHVFVGHGPF